MSRLIGQTAHFFLSYRYSTRDTILAIEPRAPRTVNNVEVICILPPSERFPARAVYTPPFRSRGMTGNRLLPHTVYKGGKNSTWTVGFHLCFIIQDSVDLSNKLGTEKQGSRSVAALSFLGQHRTIRQEQAMRDFLPDESSKSGGILCVFPTFRTAQPVKKIR